MRLVEDQLANAISSGHELDIPAGCAADRPFRSTNVESFFRKLTRPESPLNVTIMRTCEYLILLLEIYRECVNSAADFRYGV